MFWFAERLLGPMLAVARDSRNFEYMGRLHDLEDQFAANRAGVPRAFCRSCGRPHWQNIMPPVPLAGSGWLCTKWPQQLEWLIAVRYAISRDVRVFPSIVTRRQRMRARSVMEASSSKQIIRGASSLVWGLGYRDRVFAPRWHRRAPTLTNRLTVQVSPQASPLPGQRQALLRRQRSCADEPLAHARRSSGGSIGLSQWQNLRGNRNH